jgi:nitrogen fixation NifU-like protein
MTGEDLSEDQLDALEDSLALQGVRRYPVRIKCALLAWSALADALDQLEADGGASA